MHIKTTAPEREPDLLSSFLSHAVFYQGISVVDILPFREQRALDY